MAWQTKLEAQEVAVEEFIGWQRPHCRIPERPSEDVDVGVKRHHALEDHPEEICVDDRCTKRGS
jgi:hypothetical protein